MQTSNFIPRITTFLAALSLCACGGGGAGNEGSDGNLPDAQDFNRVNNYNYAYVYALGEGAYRRFGEVNVLRKLAVQTMLNKASLSGDYRCGLGGSLRMDVVGKTYSFSFNNCDVGSMFVSSGQLILDVNDQVIVPGQAPVEYGVNIKTLSYRADSTAQLLQVMDASVGERFISGGKTLDVAYFFFVSQNDKKQRYAGSVTKVPGAEAETPSWIAIHTDVDKATGAVNYAKTLDVRAELGDTRLIVTGRGDKSSVTGTKLAPTGQSIKLEVRAYGSDTPTLEKIISANDLQELVWRAL
ncbi:hypothetical protein LNV09_08430 [Paucibacter sp. B2R-40]|uniref:hypothetical protein n=1 Tax=Paucibacter sp. B2R-40 TaxID=2893554 RepID=UPI0021E41470|nr:hypothetical protein [Paucibacter sp. B2R-40]MCV2354191.1 hypothetical protein [Paucibacter sp. B2R-40]